MKYEPTTTMPSALHVLVHETTPEQGERFERSLRSLLLPYGLSISVRHVTVERGFFCSVRLSIPPASDMVFEDADLDPDQIPGRILQWMCDIGVLPRKPIELSQGTSSLEEQIVLRRLSDLGYL